MYSSNGYTSHYAGQPYNGAHHQQAPLFSSDSPASMASTESASNGFAFPSAPTISHYSGASQPSGRRMPPHGSSGPSSVVGAPGTSHFSVGGGSSPASSSNFVVSAPPPQTGPTPAYDPSRFAPPPPMSSPGVPVGGSGNTRRHPTSLQVSPPLSGAMPPPMLGGGQGMAQFHLNQYGHHPQVSTAGGNWAGGGQPSMVGGLRAPHALASTHHLGHPPLFSGPTGGAIVGSGTTRRKVPGSGGGGGSSHNYSSAHSDSSQASRRSTPSQSTVGGGSTNKSIGVNSHASPNPLGGSSSTGGAIVGSAGGAFGASNSVQFSTNGSPPPFTTTVLHTGPAGSKGSYAVPRSGVAQASPGGLKQAPSQPASEEHRQKQRRKQVAYGKVTDGYANYRRMVPMHERQRNNVDHPSTPEVTASSSKRHWDSQVADWRRALHKWDSPDGPPNHRKPGLRTFGEMGVLPIESLADSQARALREIEYWQQEVAAYRTSAAEGGDDVDGLGTEQTTANTSAISSTPPMGEVGGGGHTLSPFFGDAITANDVRQWQEGVDTAQGVSLGGGAYDPRLYRAPASATSDSLNYNHSHAGIGGGSSRGMSSHDGGDTDSCASHGMGTPRSGVGAIGGSRGLGGGRGSFSQTHGTVSSRAEAVQGSHAGTARATHSSSSSVANYRRNGSASSSVVGGLRRGSGGARGHGRTSSAGGGTFADNEVETPMGAHGHHNYGSKSLNEGPTSIVKMTAADAVTLHVIGSMLVAEQQLEQQGLLTSAGGLAARSNSNLGASAVGVGVLPSSDAGSALSSPQTPSIAIVGPTAAHHGAAGVGPAALGNSYTNLTHSIAVRTMSHALVREPLLPLPNPYAHRSGTASPSAAQQHQQAEQFETSIEEIVDAYISRLGMQFALDHAYWLPPSVAGGGSGRGASGIVSPEECVSPSSLSPSPQQHVVPVAIASSLGAFKAIVIERVARGVRMVFGRQRDEYELTAREDARQAHHGIGTGGVIGGVHASATTTTRTSMTSQSHSHNSDDEEFLHAEDHGTRGGEEGSTLTWVHVTDVILLPSIIYTGDLLYNPFMYGVGDEDDYEDAGSGEGCGGQANTPPSGHRGEQSGGFVDESRASHAGDRPQQSFDMSLGGGGNLPNALNATLLHFDPERMLQPDPVSPNVNGPGAH